MARNMTGEICICLPLRPIIAILAVVSWGVGVWHIIEIVVALAFSNGTSNVFTDFQYAGSCQGTACDKALREQLVSCAGNRETTFKVRYIVIGILGSLFGYLGFQGTLSRNQAMVKSFASYLLLLAVFILIICAADNIYALGCDRLSLNMERDVGAWVPSETMGLLHAQGHRDFSALSASKLKDLLGYDFLPAIFACYTAVVLLVLYFSSASFHLAAVIENGPVGLGPNYRISNDASREIDQMKDRLMNAAVEQMNPIRHHETFQTLQDGNKFPYMTKEMGSSPSISYGAVGAARPILKESP